MSNRGLGYSFLVLAIVSIPVGYSLIPLTRYLASVPMADGSRRITSLVAALWPIPTAVLTSLASLILALHFLGKARRSKDDSSGEI
jgi:hypothetical protein